jgi:3-hydroxyacyl-CoA dehydrogenase/enoyl-CoA hydratase/3-hydroxybutyryl-CoA epimerase
MTGYNYALGPHSIAVVTFDLPGKANIMNDDFMAAMDELMPRLEAQRQALNGIILTSAKRTFFAGGDLALMRRSEPGQETYLFEHFERLKGYFRRLENLNVPTVAAINGTALGGGYELCLACHRRIALSVPAIRIGLPEIQFGILPAAGGVVRLTGLIGLRPALEFLLTGRQVDPASALAAKLVDELAATEGELMERAIDWILRTSNPQQPWDVNTCTPLAHSDVVTRAREEVLYWVGSEGGPENGAAQTIAEIAVESTVAAFDDVASAETRGFVKLLLTPVAKARISAFFEDRGLRQPALSGVSS